MTDNISPAGGIDVAYGDALGEDAYRQNFDGDELAAFVNRTLGLQELVGAPADDSAKVMRVGPRFSGTGGRPARVPVVPRRLNRTAPNYEFIALQRWEGTVLELRGDQMIADLRDLTDPNGTRLVGEILLEDIAPQDAHLVVPGAVFYWSVGYETPLETGQRKRVSVIRFRRLPPRELRKTAAWKKRFNELAELFGADGDEPTGGR